MSQPQTFAFPAFNETLFHYPSSLNVYGMTDTVDTNNILYLQSEVNYTRIFLREGKTYLSSKTLKHFNGILEGPEFIRIHKSFLVNRLQVLSITPDYVLLKNGTQLPISRRKRRVLKRNRTLIRLSIKSS